MLPWLGEQLVGFYGPFRLLTSRIFLIGLGTLLTTVLSWYLLPKLWCYLPRNKGREFSADPRAAVGKPRGAGIILVAIFVVVGLLVLPFGWQFVGILLCVLLTALEGFADDRKSWSRLQLGAADLAISLLGAIILSQLHPVVIWLPLVKGTWTLEPWIFIPLATGLIWLAINATNCTDGVDGLSGSLSALALVSLGGILYAIVGHEGIAQYLLVPHYPDDAIWGMMAFVMVGCLGGYLWYNAYPADVLMGDAGSRALGFLLGVLILASGNPFMVFVVTTVVLVNGLPGLLKVLLIKIRDSRRLRLPRGVRSLLTRLLDLSLLNLFHFPLHDHFKATYKWESTQVFVRFIILQAIATPLFLLFLLKVR